MTEEQIKNKEREKNIREISIGVSSALLVACFTLSNEFIGIDFKPDTPAIISYGFMMISCSMPFLAIDIYSLFLYKPDGTSTRKERSALAIRILVWLFTTVGLFFVFGGKQVLVDEEKNSISLIYCLIVGCIFAFFYFRSMKEEIKENGSEQSAKRQ